MLEVSNLSKTYRGRTVLHPVSFTLKAGECLGIAGANGSGKSTLLRILAQVEMPDSGRILFAGQDVRRDRTFPRSRLGYVPQDDALMEELTCSRQISLWQAACGRKGPLPAGIVELMGIEGMMRRRIAELSGGMRRRLSIALALAGEPPVLIMDEATSALDGDYCSALMDWLEQYLRRGGRIVWCSHHAEELERLCDRCLILRDGQSEWKNNV